MKVQPYLFFDGRCEEALRFYQKVLGAQIIMQMCFKDSPEPPNAECGPVDGNKIMHVTFRVGETEIMASDGNNTGKPSFQGFALSITAPTEGDADRIFTQLSDGGQVTMPLTKTFFSPKFGMLADQFGVHWMILVAS